MFRSDHAMWLAIRIRSARRKRTVVRFASDSPVEGDGFELPVRKHRAMAPSHGFAAASHREAALRGAPAIGPRGAPPCGPPIAKSGRAKT